jgi:hypothetical protein
MKATQRRQIRRNDRFTAADGIRYMAIQDEMLDAVPAVMVPSSIHSPTIWVRRDEIEERSIRSPRGVA